MAEITLDVAGRGRLDQVLVALLPAETLPGTDGDVYLDDEGTPIARRVAGAVTALGPLDWRRPADVASNAPVIVATAGRIPLGSLPTGALVLVAAAGTRVDDARQTNWRRAWTAGASESVLIPVPADDAAARAPELAAAYSSGPLVEVTTTRQPAGPGRTVFLTGLSGSGKSTIARALVARLAVQRTVTLLDGDVVRTHLSRGLGFSREDRDLNIRRIGWVAGEVTKHGGLAVCAPIAPYDETRQWVRRTVESAGGPGSFVLVWVSTPLEECERRDVKGLYARARAGEITGFTGIDDPYEPPADAELAIDTTDVTVDAAVDQIVRLESAVGTADSGAAQASRSGSRSDG
jgi:sulfate adenylyltransferase